MSIFPSLKASEYGHRDVVSFLIESGADGRMHPVTKYSPLYIAAYNGKKDIVEILLKKFPELINVKTGVLMSLSFSRK